MMKKVKLVSMALVAVITLLIGCNFNSDGNIGQEFSVGVSGSYDGLYYFVVTEGNREYLAKGYVKKNGAVCSKKEGDDIVEKFKFEKGILYISIYKDRAPRTNHNMYVFDKNHNHIGNIWFELIGESYFIYYREV